MPEAGAGVQLISMSFAQRLRECLKRLIGSDPVLELSRSEAAARMELTVQMGSQSISLVIADEAIADASSPEALALSLAEQIHATFVGQAQGGKADSIPLPVELMKDLETFKPGAAEERIREVLTKPEGSGAVTLNTGAGQVNSFSFATTMSSFQFGGSWGGTVTSMPIIFDGKAG